MEGEWDGASKFSGRAFWDYQRAIGDGTRRRFLSLPTNGRKNSPHPISSWFLPEAWLNTPNHLFACIAEHILNIECS